MVINENNSQINSFIKGMNSDVAYDQIENTQYVYGKNIRITKNQSIGGHGDYSSLHEGIVAPVPSGINVQIEQQLPEQKIIYAGSIERIVVVITNTIGENDINVYRFILNEETNEVESFINMWHADNVWKNATPDQISAVLYKELDNVTKIYIATGEHPIISFRIDDDNIENLKNATIDDLINNRILPQSRVRIKNVISGRLLTSQVQYTYRFYNKYGNTTQLAPLTNKIQVIDPSRSKEIGNAQNTETSIGFTLGINIGEYKNKFTGLQIYRLQYITPNQDAEVSLIYDGNIKSDDADDFVLHDVGIQPIQQMSMEEFAAMSGIILIPKALEQNQEYMFCANVTDDTIIKDLSIEEDDSRISIVKAQVILSENIEGDIPEVSNIYYKDSYNSISGIPSGATTVTEYLQERGIDVSDVKASYDDIFTSSLLRSLRRGETYKYAIVYYDKYGRRSDVQPLGKITIPEIDDNNPTFTCTDKLIANPVGVKIKIPTPQNADNIIGCQIVRRSSSEIYQKTLLQVALARPIRQGLLETNLENINEADKYVKWSPYYPTGILTTNNITIKPTYYVQLLDVSGDLSTIPDGPEATFAKSDTNRLFQIFSSEIDFRRDDVLSKLNTSDLTVSEKLFIPATFSKYTNGTKDGTYGANRPSSIAIDSTVPGGRFVIDRRSVERLTVDKKQARHWIFNFFENQIQKSGSIDNKVTAIKDVKMADQYSAFSNIIRDDDLDIRDAVKKYKSYTTNIDSFLYNNWVSFGKYDFRPGIDHVPNMDGPENVEITDPREIAEMIPNYGIYNGWLNEGGSEDQEGFLSALVGRTDILFLSRNGYIGPGPSCFLMTIQGETGVIPIFNGRFHTSICNITHNVKQDNVEADEFTSYYGFGNYFKLHYDINTEKLLTDNGSEYATVFDGDIYITPHEFTTMYKTYNFESYDTLQSTQITSYIPLESKVNTCLDYGKNLRNTVSENLLYEPGSVDGVTTQDRPIHQYNMIYSDNDASNDVFTLITTDKNETNKFKQRAYYSELKTNGEFIDNFLIFKAAAFIDVDSKYGQITNLLTDKNMLYYWQDHAFGKFSVNERSLINDQNNNTIMLGQAGILSRYDYLSTKYGMREQDFCASSTENGIYWVDINNKAVVGFVGNNVIDYGERAGVQNIINDKITQDIPKVDYDIQNSELMCKCFGNDQIIFNLKYNIATSIYNRNYDDIVYIKNHVYGLKIQNGALQISKYNYLTYNTEESYLAPIELQFVVNPQASITKVFDSQQIIPIKRDVFESTTHILDRVQMAFETDITSKTYGIDMEPYTDREGNIIYNIPRYDNKPYGNRIRGKWMKVSIKNDVPTQMFTISHLITKFRQSFS